MSKNLVGNWVNEKSTTSGAGDILLEGASVGNTKFQGAVASGKVYYSVLDANGNREAGEGTFNGVNTIVRTLVKATLIGSTYNDINPVPIHLSGSLTVSCTFNATTYLDLLAELVVISDNQGATDNNLQSHLDDATASHAASTISFVPTADVSSDDVQGAIEGLGVSGKGTADALEVLDVDVSFRESAITALEIGGVLTGNGPTSVLIAAGSGEIIDSFTATENQVTADITWGEISFDLLTNAGMPVVTGLGYTEITINSSGLARAHPNGVSSAIRRSEILIGLVEYRDQVITAVRFQPIISNSIGNTFMDLMDFTPLSDRIKGLTTRPTNIGDMTLWRDSGLVFAIGGNFENSISDPNVKLRAAEGSDILGIDFTLLTYNNGTTVALATVDQVPVELYEPDGAGTVSALANGKSTIHYLFEGAAGFYLAYGQVEYPDYATAITNLYGDRANFRVPAESEKMLLLAQIVILKNTTTWGPAAEVFPIGSSTSSGSTGGSASAAINVAYTDTYSLGNNVQTALDSLATVKLTPDQDAAMDAANAPSGSNPLVTQNDLVAATPDVDLSYTPSPSKGIVTNTGGTDSTIPAATSVNAGLLLPSEKDIIAISKVEKTSSTGSAIIPIGSTTQRGVAPVEGYFRANSTLGRWEGYLNGLWGLIGGGATGGGSDEVFVQNSQIVTTDYTVPSGKNAESVGPITVNAGVTVTLSTGSNWVIL